MMMIWKKGAYFLKVGAFFVFGEFGWAASWSEYYIGWSDEYKIKVTIKSANDDYLVGSEDYMMPSED